MRFLPTDEQLAFTGSLHTMLAAAGTPAAARAWAAGDPAPGRAVWARLAEAGVFALAVPESRGGLGPLPAELALAFVELGRHAVPGPLVETVAAAALLTALEEPAPAERLLPGIAAGEVMATLRLPGPGPYALDADAATCVLVVDAAVPGPRPGPPGGGGAGDGADDGGADANGGGGRGINAGDGAVGRDVGGGGGGGGERVENGDGNSGGSGDASRRGPGAARPQALRIAPGHGPVRASVDPVRRLAVPEEGGEVLAAGPGVAAAAARAADWARLATAAQALGAGLALLDRTAEHVVRRTQFGVPIGSFQAVKHRLADTLIALEFARPLVLGAAVSMARADIAAAKVAAGEAAYGAARTALQLHGAIGYTEELDLALWLRKARPLRDAWGTPAQCRAAVLRP
ncbi:acyl-CoA dehydrogenase family protein [Streptomyces tirandamycinicus]|uniref:Acyl-CoA dehydrogenase n=1 Tax=Streptomyces tirandamycinicus TaxID=2174846 RepID=A0A2S1SNJ5_9ACTN|nr:acyl-CoA dehydrogenase family protein [Streptomyces tirandamycinicus]AWI27932.1 acyl-CoA dehydrogenase [Streptomyces tirandamycinicus]